MREEGGMDGEPRVNVRRVVLLRHPPSLIWTALRDELPSVGAAMDGIETIHRLERAEAPGGVVLTVHEWRASASLSNALKRHIDAGVLSWVERARWEEDGLESHWTVESRLLKGGMMGSGLTRLEPAMGGRGSRLHFQLSTSLGPGVLGPLGQGRWKAGLEDAAAALLARTLQELGTAVETFLSGGNGRGR